MPARRAASASVAVRPRQSALADRLPFARSLLPIVILKENRCLASGEGEPFRTPHRRSRGRSPPRLPRSHIFNGEGEYYRDLRVSCFAITTRRGGWDCLRHYEIAANGCVPFRDLNRKPPTSPPYSSRRGENCLLYRSYEELIEHVEGMSAETYAHLPAGALRWAGQNSTRHRALRFSRPQALSRIGRSASVAGIHVFVETFPPPRKLGGTLGPSSCSGRRWMSIGNILAPSVGEAGGAFANELPPALDAPPRKAESKRKRDQDKVAAACPKGQPLRAVGDLEVVRTAPRHPPAVGVAVHAEVREAACITVCGFNTPSGGEGLAED